ncbi:hypothetical protein [Amycolatopsis sp. lyj-90]|uniref:hypothetical protein n=1 Tax=Amycolatopsis sp. lyj-90 TaxID=2789285 RepID=UPI00397CD338
MTEHDDCAITEDHVELCGTPIFDSVVDETRRATSGNSALLPSSENNSERNEQHAEADNGDYPQGRPA